MSSWVPFLSGLLDVLPQKHRCKRARQDMGAATDGEAPPRGRRKRSLSQPRQGPPPASHGPTTEWWRWGGRSRACSATHSAGSRGARQQLCRSRRLLSAAELRRLSTLRESARPVLCPLVF